VTGSTLSERIDREDGSRREAHDRILLSAGQLHAIEEIGLDSILAQQLHKEEDEG
jgi:hypothetical protein